MNIKYQIVSSMQRLKRPARDSKLLDKVDQDSAAKQRGFTIIELLIATTVFSVVLLMATAGILEITRRYYQGVVQSRTQEAARVVVDEIAESIRYGSNDVTVPVFTAGPDIVDTADDTGNFCLGTRRYSFAIDRQLVSNSPDSTKKEKKHVLWVDDGACSVNTPYNPGDAENLDAPVSDGREVLSENMRLTRMRIIPVTAGAVYRIEVGVAYGADDLLDVVGDYKQCIPVETGSEFCATSNVSVTVTRRL